MRRTLYLVAAKLALYSAMREQGITKTALAKRLGLSESVPPAAEP